MNAHTRDFIYQTVTETMMKHPNNVIFEKSGRNENQKDGHTDELILSPLCLPIPPQRRQIYYSTKSKICQEKI